MFSASSPYGPRVTTAPPTRIVPEELSGSPLDGAVKALFELTWGKARKAVETGKISVDGAVETDGLRRVRKGAVLTMNERAPKPRPAEIPESTIVHVDAHVVVVDKPAGTSTVPYDDTETGTLDEKVRAYLSRVSRGSGNVRPSLGVVHRIDKETSGLVVFTRTWLAKEALSSQFRAHTTTRRYFAIVHGEAHTKTIVSHLVADRGDGVRGSVERRRGGARGGKPGTEGQRSVTHVEVVERLEGATLVACRLETGRTHQIRVHLAEDGHPLVGEKVYIRGYRGEEIPAERAMLHAALLGFVHPKDEVPVVFTRPWPTDFERTLRRLGGKSRFEDVIDA